jgi:hypothetical protein
LEEGEMSRGLLDNSILFKISQELPDLENLSKAALSLSPDFISLKFSPESLIPVAAVCLEDTLHALSEARYALHECFAHQIWYKEKSEPPNEAAAVFFGRFYADDTALRLYSSGEHLANAIIFMLEISDRQLEPYRENRVSQQSIVGNFLVREEPNHPITKAVLRLPQSKEWRKTIEYRSTWVHEQPPTVKGLGIVYNRNKRWQLSKTGKSFALGIGGGDEPEYSSVDDLLRFIQPALFLFTDIFTLVVQFYIELLTKRGFTFGQDISRFDSMRTVSTS